MTIGVPPEYILKVANLMTTTWGKQRRSFIVKEAEMLVGQLAHISNCAPWLKHLLSHIYTSIAFALGNNTSFLICTNKSFREQMKIAKGQSINESDERQKTFAQSEMARKVHNLKKVHIIPPTMIEELDIIRSALTSPNICKSMPIAHLIPDRDDGDAHGDSSLNSAGGWSTAMRFWWWIAWPEDVRKRTLRFVKTGASGLLIDINALEYATIIISYAAAVHFWIIQGNCV
ncbi:hypothetical protein ACHAXR_003564 [Thalassiosira sp. AJA248-18]